jgi:branched-chain amino acid transport system substrate-binding protein
MRKALRALALVTAVAVAAAGCGGDDDTAKPSSTTAANQATGAPIEIANISTLESPNFSAPQVQAALDAAVEALNARGGIKGRPVKVTYCNDKFDANAAGACARQVVDSGEVAVVGSLSPVFPAAAPALEGAKVPWIGGLGSNPAELKSPISYPFQSATASTTAGLVRFLADKGAAKIALITGDDASSLAIPDQARAAAATGGAELGKVVSGANGHADWSAEVSAATSGDPDAVAFFGTGADVAKVVTGLRQSGYEGMIGVPGSVFTPQVIGALGSAADGVYAALRLGSPDDTSNPEVVRFRNELKAHDPKVVPDEIALNTWTALQLFAKVVEGIDGEITPASVIVAFDGLTAPVELGVVPDYPPAPATPPNAALPRVRSFFVAVAKVDNGQYVPDGGFFDPFKP